MKAIVERDTIKLFDSLISESLGAIECEAVIEGDEIRIRLPEGVLCLESPMERMIKDLENPVTVCDIDRMAKALEIDED